MPHGIYIDDENYYYTTDVGSHQVIKWQLSNGQLAAVLTLGERFVPGSDEQHFCKPAGVVVSKKDGSIYVADGYCNNRIMHFSKSGKFIAEFGQASTSAGREISQLSLGFFQLPHDITLDEENERIYVADRENGRVQMFDLNTYKPISEIRDNRFFGNVYSVHYCPGMYLIFVFIYTFNFALFSSWFILYSRNADSRCKRD